MHSLFKNERVREFLARHAAGIWITQALLIGIVGFAVAWTLKGETVTADKEQQGENDPHADHQAKATIWTCSMHPQIRRDKPGKCPLCGMKLVPVTDSSAGGMRTISISPTARKLMDIQTSPVERRYVTADVRMVGKVEYDETRLAHITAWVSGRLDRLYVDYTGIEVKKGDHLVYIYSEELYSTQVELLKAIENQSNRAPPRTTLVKPIDLVASAREKLRLLGMTPEQISEIEQRGTPADHVTIYSPAGGVVVKKLREEGDRVRTGDRIYTVADLSHVWIKLDAYESDVQWLKYGQEVEFDIEAYPGETFKGRIAFIDRELSRETRTAKVRVNLQNTDGRLKPEMFVRATVHSKIAAGDRVLDAGLSGKWISPMHPEIVKEEPGDCDICGMPLVRAESLGYVTAEINDAAKPLVIPTSAALVTGRRAIVYVEVPTAEKPTYEGREIVLGPRAGNYYLVRNGLKAGDLVVTNGNFKLDSALQISAKPSMMTPEGGGGGGHDHGGGAKPKSDENTGRQVTLSPAIRRQLESVNTAYDEVTSALREADLDKIRKSFSELGNAASQVDQKQLSGHAAMLWQEYAMLLGNDAVEGQDVETMQHADELLIQLRRHMERVSQSFGLGADQEEPVIRLNVSDAFRGQLTRLLDAYLPIGASLAADDLLGAKRGTGQLRSALATIQSDELDEDAAKAWRREQSNLDKIIARLTEAKDLQSTRSGFALLSDEMLALVKSFGVQGKRPAYELHCPMAFDGRGAIWIQDSDKPRNPYYGASMLPCADRVEPLNFTKDASENRTEHEGHGQ